MPYRRRYKSRRKVYNKKYGRGNTWASNSPALARTALKTAKWVASLVNVEYKVTDNDISMNVQNAAYSTQYLTGIAQGDDMNQRNGRSILGKSLYFQLRVYLGNTFNSAVCRLVLVEDTTGDGTTPTAADLFVTTSGDNAVNAFRQVLNQETKRYRIWWDKRISLDQDFKNEIYISKYIKMRKHHIKYIGTGSTSTNAGPGSFWLMCISTSAIASGVYPINISGQSRLRYIDN